MLSHLSFGILFPLHYLSSQNPLLWLMDIPWLLFDLMYMPELHTLIRKLYLGKKLRPLTQEEIRLAQEIFEESIVYDKVLINSYMPARMKRYAVAYVTINIINYNTKLRQDILIHELVHVWQFQHYGSRYIVRALYAQVSKSGYDYGGMEALYDGMLKGRKFTSFNFEQQGDIVQHAFLQKKGLRGVDNQLYNAVYKYYLDQLHLLSRST